MSEEKQAPQNLVESFSTHPMGREEGEKFILAYMDKVDWECEAGLARSTRIYGSPEDLRRKKRCIDHCGIVQVKIEFVKTVQDGYENIEGEESMNFSKVRPETVVPFSQIELGKHFGYRGEVFIKAQLDFLAGFGYYALNVATGKLRTFGEDQKVVSLENNTPF